MINDAASSLANEKLQSYMTLLLSSILDLQPKPLLKHSDKHRPTKNTQIVRHLHRAELDGLSSDEKVMNSTLSEGENGPGSPDLVRFLTKNSPREAT